MNSLFRANSIRGILVFLGVLLTVFTASIVGLTSVNISSQAIIKHTKVLAIAFAEDLAAECV
ncbi:MAG: hypothetical protein Q8M92_10910, partial [Candidatus Subteraquimicrobiales bacterium]|nr:hypothetical protein [Candidatus Subteraquimicrobiales bacterium]